MAARALTALLLMPLIVNALEQLDDSSMSDVVAQEGVRLTSEYEMYVQSISLIDTDDGGSTTLSDITQGTRPNRQQIIDFKIVSELELHDSMYGVGEFEAANSCTDGDTDCGERLGLAFLNRDLPYDMEIGAIEINGKTVGSMGVTDFEVNAFQHHTDFIANMSLDQQSLNITAFAGGADGRGMNLSVYVPKTAQLKQYFEIDGVQLSSTVGFIDVDPDSASLTEYSSERDTNGDGVITIEDYSGGLDLKGITIDGHEDGILIGLPTMENGLIAVTDLKIGNDDIGYEFINDIIFKDIHLTGGSLLVKPDLNVGGSSVNMDMTINANTGFTYVYRDDKDQINANVHLAEDLVITGASINTDKVSGLELGLGSIKGKVVIDEVSLAPNFYSSAQRMAQAPLGEITLNLNIANTSYLHVRGNQSMKIINIEKTVLCLLCSASAFSMQSIDDAELSNIDGRAGITIETQLHDTTTIDSVTYTDGDGDGEGHTDSASISLSDISIGASSATTKIDVFADGVLNIEISDIVQGDLWIRKIAMGDEEASIGAMGITNFNYDAAGSYNVQLAIVDPMGNGANQAALIFDFDLANSSFDTTFIEEAEFAVGGDRELINGNTISYRTQFGDFKALATTVYIDDALSPDDRAWIRMDLGSITGSARLENIAFGSITEGVMGTSEVFGSVGFGNINIEDTSFLAISGHDPSVSNSEGINFKIAAKANIENFYFETEGNRANFGNIDIDTDGRGIDGSSNVPFDISLDLVSEGNYKGISLLIDNVNDVDITIRDLYLSQYDEVSEVVSNEAVFGSIGIENINFNGGSSQFDIIGGIAGVGEEGVLTRFSLPDGTTLDFTVNDYEDAAGNSVSNAANAVKGGELRASVEINDFSTESVIDVVTLGNDINGNDQGTGLKMTFKSMEGAFDLRNFSAGNGATYQGSYGRVQVDGMNLKRGYLIVDAL